MEGKTKCAKNVLAWEFPAPFMKEEIEAGEKSSFPRAAVQTPDRCRVRKLGAFTNTHSTGLIFLGIYLLSVSPVFAPELSSQNIYIDRPPTSPRAASDPSDGGGNPSGTRMSEGHWAPSPVRTGSRHITGVHSSSCAHWQEQMVALCLGHDWTSTPVLAVVTIPPPDLTHGFF